MPDLRVLDEIRVSASSLANSASAIGTPTLRLGVTGLSRAGKTVFITALIHALVHQGHLPAFKASRSGRLVRAVLTQQPDDDVARFSIEQFTEDLLLKRIWPESTRHLSQLRLTLHFEPISTLARALGRTKLHLDLIDYPGEWLLDLPLLDQDYQTFSQQSLDAARSKPRHKLARLYLEYLNTIEATEPLEEPVAQELSARYAAYLRAAKSEENALSMLPPGRFLMPGDLDGSPALTFTPLDRPTTKPPKNSLYDAMEKRFEAYKRVVVRPFFVDHFARLDRQVVLVDALAAINAGPEALSDLENALAAILASFKTGQNSILSRLFGPRIDRIVFAATKADHLHHSQHERLEAVLDTLIDNAKHRAVYAGADAKTMAVASVRATREASANAGAGQIGAVAGTPMAGEKIGGQTLDGEREVAIFPGDLPEDPMDLFGPTAKKVPLKFVRFRPPKIEHLDAEPSGLPHIRLDRLLETLLGDHLN